MAQKQPSDFLPRDRPDPPPPAPAPRSRFYLSWIYERAPDNGEYLLLDNERRASSGVWYGNYGKPFIAYSTLPRSDKRIEKELILKGIIKA